jgi:hypothetical protein
MKAHGVWKCNSPFLSGLELWAARAGEAFPAQLLELTESLTERDH